LSPTQNGSVSGSMTKSEGDLLNGTVTGIINAGATSASHAADSPTDQSVTVVVELLADGANMTETGPQTSSPRKSSASRHCRSLAMRTVPRDSRKRSGMRQSGLSSRSSRALRCRPDATTAAARRPLPRQPCSPRDLR
jgi:hypothetical protein